IPGARKIAFILGCKRLLENGYFKGHTEGKTAVRVAAKVESIELHAPLALAGCKLTSKLAPHAALLHFDCCTIEEWTTKWLRRYEGTGTADRMRPERKNQFA